MTTVQKQTAGVAVASLVMAILGFVLLGPLGAIPAVICGHIAKSKIKQNPETLTGEGMALAGLIMGYIQLGALVVIVPLFAAIAIPSFIMARDTSQQNACIGNMRQIDSAKEQWALANNASEGSTVAVTAANEYMKRAPTCPAGGTYEYRPFGEDPLCTEHGTIGNTISKR
jgi:hypothetical protein